MLSNVRAAPYEAYVSGQLLADDARQALLAQSGFADWRAADQRLRRLSRDPATLPALAALLPELLPSLSQVASPDRALVGFERFAQAQPNLESLLTALAAEPRSLQLLLTLFAGSAFLSEILIRHPDYFGRLARREEPARRKSPRVFRAEAQCAVAPYLAVDGRLTDYAGALDALRRYQQWELLRVGMGDLTGMLDLPSVTAQLSRLADAIVQTCLSLILAHLGIDSDGFCVLAMGKLGGGELNYSSDIDLLFLANSDPSRYQRMATGLIEALTSATSEGFLYRVDMRLRPWGQVGPLVPTVDGNLAYLRQHARLWEKQALLKARLVAGGNRPARRFLRAATPLLYQFTAEQVRSDLHAMKLRTEAHLRETGRAWGEVKLGEGSIRDVEFVTQFLQLVYGAQYPEVRSGNTLQALPRLVARGLLSRDEQRVLEEGYVFLRTVEHYLQILDYRQTHTLPSGTGDLGYLAQRLGYMGADAAAHFVKAYHQHSAAVRAVYLSHLGGSAVRPANPGSARPSSYAVNQHLSRMSGSYATTFSEAEIERHAALIAGLDDTNPVAVEAEPADEGRWRLTVVGYDYLGELSVICGLLFAQGFSIIDGHVFTYDVAALRDSAAAKSSGGPRKLVDAFTVRPVRGAPDAAIWTEYASDLTALVRKLQAREQREAQGELAKRVAEAMRSPSALVPTLYPIDIEIDNQASDRYTVLRIDTQDTVGFLYEFTNALALNGIYIGQVTVASSGNRVRDTLLVTDSQGRKISTPERQRELRAATVLVKHFTHLLPQSPNPESALLHFHEYLGQLFRRPSWPDELGSLERPEVLNGLARLLGVSDFLWDDFLRMQYANLYPVVQDVGALRRTKTQAELAAELQAELAAAADPAAKRATLNAFKDREMFRADMRYILGHNAELSAFHSELTALVETVLAAAYHCCDSELRAQYGTPCTESGRPAALSLCVLGKCGGRELGFASDIEVMFIFSGNGQTEGPEQISSAEYFEKLVVEVVRAIQARREGIFQIDLELRPYGKAGTLAVSLDSFNRYFAPGGAAWSYERQALIKLRAISGDRELGKRVEALRDEYVYGPRTFDVVGTRAMRERQLRHLVTPGTINAKYSRGALVDVEYLVQGLQMRHGADNASLRVPNTAEAIDALAGAGLIPANDHVRLQAAYLFIRRLIDSLRVVRGNAKDLTVPPTDSEEFAFLARRLDYSADVTQLRTDLTAHMGAVQEIGARLMG